MNLSFLQIILLIWAVLLLYMIVDAGRNRRLRLFHVVVFVIGLACIVILLLYPILLSWIANIVGVEKWSDFIVYMSIIAFSIVIFSLIQHQSDQQQQLTTLCTNLVLSWYVSQWGVTTRTSNAKLNYLFLIRAYNEGSVLSSVVDEIIDAGFHKIVIVNDWSSDNTKQIINDLTEKYRNIALIIGLHHVINRWPWAANKTLFAFAKDYAQKLWCERCVTYDADGQMSIDDMKQFMSHENDKYDVVIWSRFIQGWSTHNLPLIRKLILQWGRIVTYLFNGLWLTDVSTGYRMYRSSILDKIIIRSDRFSYQNDIIDSIKNNNLSYREIPVHISYTDYSLQKWQSNMSAIKILIRLIYTSLFHR